MVLHRNHGTPGLRVLLLLSGMLVASSGMALTDADVRELKEECEAAREEALAPIREQRTQTCIEQKLRTPDHCKRYYRTYGNVRGAPGGAPIPGHYYDLPECQEWTEARETLRASRSRN